MVAGLEQGDAAFRAGSCLPAQTVRTGDEGVHAGGRCDCGVSFKLSRGGLGVHDMVGGVVFPARWVLLKRASDQVSVGYS